MTDKAQGSTEIDERHEFEKAMSNLGQAVGYEGDGYYKYSSVRLAWEAWQARAALKAQPAPTEAQGESPFKFRPWSKEAEMMEGWTAAEKARNEAQGEDSARLEWIGVEDRLPGEDLLRFLVTGRALNGGPLGVHMGVMCDGDLYFDGAAYSGGCNPCINNVVTHWMPLPPAPDIQKSQ